MHLKCSFSGTLIGALVSPKGQSRSEQSVGGVEKRNDWNDVEMSGMD